MGLFLALSAFLGVAFLAGLVAFAALCVGGGDPASEDFDHGGPV
jgi:hypothetical protein